jgi:hypothetical protein
MYGLYSEHLEVVVKTQDYRICLLSPKHQNLVRPITKSAVENWQGDKYEIVQVHLFLYFLQPNIK